MSSAPADRRPSPRPKRFPLRGLLLLLLALLLCAGGAIALYGRELSTELVRAALSHVGAPPDQLEVRSIGLDGLTIGAIRLSGGLSASSVKIGWSPRSLLSGRLTSIRIAGLTAGLTVDQGRITVDGLPPVGDSSPVAAGLPFNSLELSDARISITAAAANASVQGDATIIGSERGLYGQAALDAVAILNGGVPVRVTLQAPQWSVDEDAGTKRIVLTRAAVVLPEQHLSGTDVDIAIDMTPSAAVSARLSADIRDSAMPMRFAPLALTAQAQQDQDVVVVSGRIAAERGVALTFNGRHDMARKHALADFDLAPVRFEPDGLQPNDLLPIAGRTLRRVEGSVSARGTLAWRGALKGDVAVRLEDVGFESGIARFSDLDAVLRLESIMPPRTPGAQRITGTLQITGLPPAPLDLRFGLPGDDHLVVNAATLGLAGGTIGFNDLALARGQPIESVLELKSVDLGAMLALAGIDGLSGSGTIEGRVPVRMDDKGVLITSGRLAATGPGIVRYTGAALPEGLTGQSDNPGDAVRLLREALADFHYTELILTLDRSASGEGSLLVNLKGANPAVLDNHPFDINIRLDANFDRLAAVLLNGYAAADGLLRRVAPP